MYHVELSQFPHNHARFNLSDGELVALVDPWIRERWVELGERKWNCNQATMTILEGPRLPVQKLSMGRGWRTAQREGEDVTERVMAAAKGAMEQAAREPGANGAPAGSAVGDPLAMGVQMASLLGQDPTALLEAWHTVAAGSPGLAPSESLALAERKLRPSDTSED
ncbi:MAG TPA: hypothetical protein VFY36_12245 [Solirubrobacteraceae bacterium]|nr:hypothetical protein [Solirubrobacteraceae bacterium]